MKLISARFKGLKGIYSKSGKKEIIIDFQKCQHKIIYIIGKNGSGKSTLMSVLHPFPDSGTMYLDHEAGEKELVYLHNGVIYDMLIQYPVYANGTRAVSKAYFKEISPTGEVELNPNGTIGSYKDILLDKFELDMNFMALSYLSTEDRGIVDKKPAERKKTVASLLECIEVYNNNIYKVLAKKSTALKTLLGNITNKVQAIGDPEKLNAQIIALEQRFEYLTNEKQSVEKEISTAEATVKLLDPDNEIQNNYTRLVNELNSVNDRIKLLDTGKEESILDKSAEYLNLQKSKIFVEGSIENLKSKLDSLLIEREEDAKRITIKSQKLNSLSNTNNIKDLRDSILEYRKKISEYEKIFDTIGIDGNCLSSDEYITGLNILEELRTAVTNIKSYADEHSIRHACKYLKAGINPSEHLLGADKEIKSIENEISNLKEKIAYYSALKPKIEILKNRPEKCNIDACIFIEDALKAQAEKPDEHLEGLYTDVNTLGREKDEALKKYEEMGNIVKVYNDLSIVLRSINFNKKIISKLPIADRILKDGILIERIQSGDNFNDIYDLYKYIQYANIFSLYTQDKTVLSDLENEFKVIQSQIEMIDDLQNEINDLMKNTENIDSKMNNLNDQIYKCQKDLVDINNNITNVNDTIERLRKLEECRSEKASINSRLEVINTNISKISSEISTINKSRSKLSAIVSELKPITDQKDRLKYQYSKLAEYTAEYNQYNRQYSTVEILKKYSSPTKGGIQTIFIQLYMDKTLSMSNQLLRMMFGGELELLPYIINENEFRIPIRNLNTNLVTDDISNCSTSEKCMIAMIMSFVLAFQGSPIYNIIRLDEIDGGLDQYNRSIFPEILSKIMVILNIEQCLIVSHSSEADMADVDIISLTPVSQETIRGNIIFQL